MDKWLAVVAVCVMSFVISMALTPRNLEAQHPPFRIEGTPVLLSAGNGECWVCTEDGRLYCINWNKSVELMGIFE